MNENLEKDSTIHRLIDGLRLRLGANTFEVVDHWESDAFAIGIARRDNHSILAYISTNGVDDEQYWVCLESPPQPGSDMPYTTAGDYNVASLDELTDVIRRHLA